MVIGNLIAIGEHWITPALTAAVQGSDDSLPFVLALTPPGTQSLAPDDAVRLSRIANETAAEAVSRHPRRLRAMSSCRCRLRTGSCPSRSARRRRGTSARWSTDGPATCCWDDPVYEDFFAAAERLGQPVSDYIRTNIWITTSGMLNPALLQHALTVTGSTVGSSPPTTPSSTLAATRSTRSSPTSLPTPGTRSPRATRMGLDCRAFWWGGPGEGEHHGRAWRVAAASLSRPALAGACGQALR